MCNLIPLMSQITAIICKSIPLLGILLVTCQTLSELIFRHILLIDSFVHLNPISKRLHFHYWPGKEGMGRWSMKKDTVVGDEER